MTAPHGWPKEAREAVARAIRAAPCASCGSLADAALAALSPFLAAALKTAYQQGWSDRESDLLAGIDRVYGTEKPDGK
jgi:hypothetical protein